MEDKKIKNSEKIVGKCKINIQDYIYANCLNKINYVLQFVNIFNMCTITIFKR